MIYILMTKQSNGMKIAAIMMGATTLGLLGAQQRANAATKIDNNHVRVEAGDTLYQIANDNDTTVDALVKENNIANKHLIHIGDKLTISLPDKKDQSQPQEQPQQQVTTEQSLVSQTQTQAPAQQSTPVATTGNSSAKDWIASRESGGSYTAQNGRYYGKYQLDLAYLGGDLSPQHQEEVADQYVISRYGSWEGAQAFWASHNWY